MNSTDLIKARLLAQHENTAVCRVKLMMAKSVKKDIKYWNDQVLKSECIADGLRIALEIVNKLELKKAA